MAVNDITELEPIKVSCQNHGMVTGQFVDIKDVGGVTEANGRFKIVVPAESLNTFTLQTIGGVDVDGTGSYTFGGTIQPL